MWVDACSLIISFSAPLRRNQGWQKLRCCDARAATRLRSVLLVPGGPHRCCEVSQLVITIYGLEY